MSGRCDFTDLPTDGCAHCRPARRPVVQPSVKADRMLTTATRKTTTPVPQAVPRVSKTVLSRVTGVRPEGADDVWRDRAECRDHPDPDLFFADPSDLARNSAAKQICGRCPVVADCLRFVEEMEAQRGSRDPEGVWGGVSAQERRAARKHARAAAGKLPAECGTEGGYQRHLRRKEKTCARCRDAHAKHTAQYKRRRAA